MPTLMHSDSKARIKPDTGRPDAGVFDLPDCRACRTFRNAHFRAVADHRTSADYLIILAGKQADRVWAERLFVAAQEFGAMAGEVEALTAENEALRRQLGAMMGPLAEAKHQ